ncbi:hypothetical protein D3C84_724450 [compost metagenome]
MIAPEQIQRQIDPRRHPGRGIELGVLHVQTIGLDLGRRTQCRQRRCITPVRCHRPPAQQPGPGEHERAVADRTKALRPRAGIPQPGIERSAKVHERQLRTTGHQQQIVGLQRFAEMPVGVQRQAVGTGHHPTRHADHLQTIVILGREETIGLGKHIHGPGDIQRLNAGEYHDGYGFTHGSKRLYGSRLPVAREQP